MKVARAGEVRFGGLAAKEEAFETEAVDVRAGPGGRAGEVGEGREEIVTDDVDRGARGGGDAGAAHDERDAEGVPPEPPLRAAERIAGLVSKCDSRWRW